MSSNTIITSMVTGGTNSHATIVEEANAVATDFVTQGVVGTISLNVGSGGSGSFCVNADASPDMGVTVKAGTAYISATPSGQNAQVLRARAAADYTTYVINANASGSTKYDWIYLSVSAANATTPSAAADNVTSIVTSRSSSNTTDNGTPPTYGLLLAVVTVANGAASITNSNIYDARVSAVITQANTSVTTGWNTIPYTPNTVTANGNRSYTLTFNGIDLTGTLSPGNRLRTTRTSGAPTQCTSLNGTTQFYSKTSPTGMTFTNFPVVSAWIKLTAYGASNMTILSRFNGTSGFSFYVNPSGQLILQGFNAGIANYNAVQSYQSVPLNKWVHVAAQLDMSTATLDATHSYTMIDGINVPASKLSGGTNPTALIQAGNLEIGSWNGGLLPFAGKLAQVAVYSAAVTQATILASIHQTLVGTETSLITAYSFNNSINDLNANANNLSANGSAVATNADSPFGGQASGSISSILDYGIIQTAAFSTNTTVTVQVPEGCTIPTTGGVSAVSYSGVKAPYGMPLQKTKWRITTQYNTVQEAAGAAATTANTGSVKLVVPIGQYELSYLGNVHVTRASSNSGQISSILSATAASNTPITSNLTSETYHEATGATTTGGISRHYAYDGVSFAAQTPVYLNLLSEQITTATGWYCQTSGTHTSVQVIAENAYI